MSTIQEWTDTVHATAKSKGWWHDKKENIVEALQSGDTALDRATAEKVFETLATHQYLATLPKAAEIHALITTEVAEATEAIRKDWPAIFQLQQKHMLTPEGNVDLVCVQVTPDSPEWRDDFKPEGEATELADVVIRVMDYFGHKKWDLEQAIRLKHTYNTTRSFRHGQKVL